VLRASASRRLDLVEEGGRDDLAPQHRPAPLVTPACPGS
jgi:hypothetical protein